MKITCEPLQLKRVSTKKEVQPKNRGETQQGFALLTVLMIVALVAMMGSQLMYEQYTNIKRSSHMMHQAQSHAVQWGVESWVKTGLKLDQDNNDFDALTEQWAEPFGPISYEGGNISARLLDLNSRLNLNNVLAEKQSERKAWRVVLKRYATQNGLNERFSSLVIDWVDADDTPLADGAESNVYLLLKPAYSTANQPMAVLSELKLLDGLQRIEADVWQVLQKDLIALPKVAPINVNTAERRVLMALADWLDEGVVSAWEAERLSEPAEKWDDFITFLVNATGLRAADIKKDLPKWMVGVKSQYFLLHTQVDYGDSEQAMSAVLFRDDDNKNEIRLVQRWLSAE